MKSPFFLFCLIFLTGCAVLSPAVQNFNIVSVEDEKEIGGQVRQEITKEMVIVTDPAMNQRVKSIGNKIVKALPRRDFDYQFYVVKDDSPNAFTIPGGAIYVHTGLLRFASDDNELAGVLAHEVGHAYARHPAKALSRAYGAEYLTQLVFKNQPGGFKGIALQLAKGGLLLKYGRQDEFEADELGYDFLKRAGIPTYGLLSFFGKLQNLQQGGVSIPFLSTHPPTPERIARLEALEKGQIVSTVPAARLF
ncbi:MAG TPA: M48 family metallopeptidase [bacterium]|nr:M48 family metallopeptidase [bacterium]